MKRVINEREGFDVLTILNGTKSLKSQSPVLLSFNHTHCNSAMVTEATTDLVVTRSPTSRRLLCNLASPGPIGDLVTTSVIGGNSWSRRCRKAVSTYVWPGLYVLLQSGRAIVTLMPCKWERGYENRLSFLVINAANLCVIKCLDTTQPNLVVFICLYLRWFILMHLS